MLSAVDVSVSKHYAGYGYPMHMAKPGKVGRRCFPFGEGV